MLLTLAEFYETINKLRAERIALHAEVERLRTGLEMIRDREALEPSDYIAAYGEPVGSPGDLARTMLEGDK